MARRRGPTAEIFPGRKVVLIAVPGAFTPTCSMNHLPPYIAAADALKAKGIDEVLVTGVNDVFVMGAWAKHTGGEGKVTYLADGSAHFAEAMGLTLDLDERGLGTRSKRYAMVVDDGVVKSMAVEPKPRPGRRDQRRQAHGQALRDAASTSGSYALYGGFARN